MIGAVVWTTLQETGTGTGMGGKLTELCGEEDPVQMDADIVGIEGRLRSKLFVVICFLAAVEFLSRLLVTMRCRLSRLDIGFVVMSLTPVADGVPGSDRSTDCPSRCNTSPL